MKKILLRDVAEIAGVSQMTVSRVINNPETVHPDTRGRVEKIIKQLNYQPNSFAKSLSTGKTNNIGLLVVYDTHKFPNSFMPLFLKGASDVIQRNNYKLMLMFDRHDGQNHIISENVLAPNKFDGLLILSVDSDLETVYQLSYKLREFDIPAVVANQAIDNEKIGYVSTDDFNGGFKAASYLINQGHRKIGIITGSEQYSTSWNRFKGFISALEEHGLMFHPSAYAEGFYTKEGGYDAMGKLLNNAPDMSAVFCASDLMALGAMKCCFDKNLAIPDDISIIGYDDVEFASMLNPALTTVRKDRERMGREAAEILINMINGTREPIRLMLDTEVIERDSVKKYYKPRTLI